MLSILIVAIFVAHINCDSTNQANSLSTNDNGAQGYRELSNEYKLSIPSQFDDDSHARYRRYANPQRNGNAQQNRSNAPPCPTAKPTIRNSKSRCKNNICSAQCDKNRQLPNGKTSAKLQCIAGQWVWEGFEKDDKPACELKVACPMKPETKQAEATDCGSNNCTITCAAGFALPDGSMSMQLTCKNGKWESSDPQQNFPPNCESMCDGDRVYKECSKTNEKSCASAEQEEELSAEECIQGCFCPDGTVEHEGNCIQPDKCPETACNFEGQTYAPGQEMQKDCNTCKCEKGEMKCTEKECAEPDPARCEVFGDPHYRTFDGKSFDFMGKCSYYLMRTDYGLDVIAENGDCPRGFSKEVSCTKSVTMKVPYDNDKIVSVALKQGGRVEVNGQDKTHYLPMTVLEDYMVIRQVGPAALMAVIQDGMQVVWDGFSYAYIDAPGSIANQTKGLCGNFDGNPENDLTTPDGKLQQSPDTFGNEWGVKEMCDPRQNNDNVPHPCQQTSEQQQQQILNVCARLKSNVFSRCSVDPVEYISNCIYDLCAQKTADIAPAMCTIFSAYANECSRNGTPIKWRESIPECAMKCPAGQVHVECSKNCYRSCADLQMVEKTCQTGNCVAGCRCPDGQALDENQRCIPVDKCPCKHNGRAYNSGNQQTQQRAGGPQLCTCKGAKWDCEASGKDKDSVDQNVESIEDSVPTEVDTESSAKDDESTESTERAEPTEQITEPTERNEETTEPNALTTERNAVTTEPNLNTTKRSEKSPEKNQPTEKNIKPKEPNAVELSPAKEKECMNDKSKTVSNCLPLEPKTCKNMINYRKERVGECKKGCVCKDDYVLDTASNKCVEPTSCGCEHEGKNHQSGGSMKRDCNACICQSGEWYCTNRKCDTENVNDNHQESTAVDKRQADTQPPKSCEPRPLDESKTIGMVQVSSAYGKCVNKQPIRGFAVCRGSCSSGTKFNGETLEQEQKCTCCSVDQYDELSVPIVCGHGITGSAKVQIPKSCSCRDCIANGERGNPPDDRSYAEEQPGYGLRLMRFFNRF